MKSVRPAASVPPGYVAAFSGIASRIQATILKAGKKAVLPVRMVVAGGAAVLFYTGTRVSLDIDATLSQRILLPEQLESAYADGDGAPRVLYFDRQYNDTYALMHENAADDAHPLKLPGIDPAVLDIRLLSPTDLAVSKLARYADHDQDDIAALARHGLIDASGVRKRAEQALIAFVGETRRVKTSIRLACALIERQHQG